MDENKKFFWAIGLFLVIIFALSYYIIQEGQRDTYTVLYFSNPVEPLSYSVSDNTIKVNFIIENHERRDVTYTYLVVLDQDKGTIKKIKSEIVLRSGEIRTISEIFAGIDSKKTSKVATELFIEGSNESYRRIWYED